MTLMLVAFRRNRLSEQLKQESLVSSEMGVGERVTLSNSQLMLTLIKASDSGIDGSLITVLVTNNKTISEQKVFALGRSYSIHGYRVGFSGISGHAKVFLNFT